MVFVLPVAFPSQAAASTRPAVRVPVASTACRVAVVAVAAVFVQRDHFLLSAAVSALHALLALPVRTA